MNAWCLDLQQNSSDFIFFYSLFYYVSLNHLLTHFCSIQIYYDKKLKKKIRLFCLDGEDIWLENELHTISQLSTISTIPQMHCLLVFLSWRRLLMFGIYCHPKTTPNVPRCLCKNSSNIPPPLGWLPDVWVNAWKTAPYVLY